MANDLEKKIGKQIEYYFGDINLPRDKFLQEKIKEDEGWVPLEVMLKFKRLAGMSEDLEIIAAAVEKSENKLMQVSEDKKKVRRNPDMPIPEQTEETRKELMKRSAYAKGFASEETLNDIINFMEPYGPVESVIRRTTPDHKFKGSCFVVFKDLETCKKFVETESIKYKEVELVRKMQNDYYANKKKEIEERKKLKKEKQEASADTKPDRQIDLPKGAIVYFSGISDGQTLTREEIKDKVKEVGGVEAQFIDFKKGDAEGWVRFPSENDAVDFCQKLDEPELTIGEAQLKLKCLEGDEEQEYLKKTSESILKLRQSKKFGGKNNGRKRKGNYGGHGHHKRNRN